MKAQKYNTAARLLHCYKDRGKIPTYMVDVSGPNNRADGIIQHVYVYRDSGHFQHVPISTVEFSNTFQHEYRNFPKISLHIVEFSNIFQHM